MSPDEKIPLVLWSRKYRVLIELYESAVWRAHLLDDGVPVVRTNAEWQSSFDAWRSGEDHP